MSYRQDVAEPAGRDHTDTGAIPGDDSVGGNRAAVYKPGELLRGAIDTFKRPMNTINDRLVRRLRRGGELPDMHRAIGSSNGHIRERSTGIDGHVQLLVWLTHDDSVTPFSVDAVGWYTLDRSVTCAAMREFHHCLRILVARSTLV